MTAAHQCLGEVRVYFFDHHGGDGPEQQVGSIVFPDFYVDPEGDAPGASTDEIAVRIWNAHCALSDLAFQGHCMAIVGTEDATPTSGQDGPHDPRFNAVWRAHDYLHGRLTRADGALIMEPLDVVAYTSQLLVRRSSTGDERPLTGNAEFATQEPRQAVQVSEGNPQVCVGSRDA